MIYFIGRSVVKVFFGLIKAIYSFAIKSVLFEENNINIVKVFLYFCYSSVLPSGYINHRIPSNHLAIGYKWLEFFPWT